MAINLAGIGGIAVARRGALEEAARGLELLTGARARAIESALASIRADLAFLTGSPTFFGLEAALASRDPREVRFRRLEAEGALLLFLRAHSEVTHLVARSGRGTPLVEVGRRGGVPVLWVPDGRSPTRPEGRPITGAFAFTSGVRTVSGAVTLEATLDPGVLLARGESAEQPAGACRLSDRDGAPLAPHGAARTGTVSDATRSAEAPIETEGWSAPSPWRLACARRGKGAFGPFEPVATRYRATLVLNLAVMTLALALGTYAFRETRRRRDLETEAGEEARVRELERRLFHAERLTTVGRLAAGMAHEINNPLEGMSNYLSLARDDLARDDAAAALGHLAGVQEGLQRAVGIVRQVLAHADPAKAPKSPSDLRVILQETLQFVEARPEFRAIRFEFEAASGLGVRGSQTLLGQVFLNLLLNACEAQPRGGEVSVRAFREGPRIVVAIADRGPGVPADAGPRIFEPFYSTKSSTGLGLSICYSIVADHGGTLGVSNREGGGAVFTIGLPAEGGGA